METFIQTKHEHEHGTGNHYQYIESLYKRWASILKNYANYFVNDDEASSSIVNDIFMKLWSNKHEIENTQAYLFRSVKNASFNHLTSISKRPLRYVELQELTEISDQAQPHEFSVEESTQLTHLHKLIAKLPEKRQLVFRMHRIEGFNYNEIADLLQISPRTVEDHLAKSIKFIHDNSQHFFNRHLTEA